MQIIPHTVPLGLFFFFVEDDGGRCPSVLLLSFLLPCGETSPLLFIHDAEIETFFSLLIEEGIAGTGGISSLTLVNFGCGNILGITGTGGGGCASFKGGGWDNRCDAILVGVVVRLEVFVEDVLEIGDPLSTLDFLRLTDTVDDVFSIKLVISVSVAWMFFDVDTFPTLLRLVFELRGKGGGNFEVSVDGGGVIGIVFDLLTPGHKGDSDWPYWLSLLSKSKFIIDDELSIELFRFELRFCNVASLSNCSSAIVFIDESIVIRFSIFFCFSAEDLIFSSERAVFNDFFSVDIVIAFSLGYRLWIDCDLRILLNTDESIVLVLCRSIPDADKLVFVGLSDSWLARLVGVGLIGVVDNVRFETEGARRGLSFLWTKDYFININFFKK